MYINQSDECIGVTNQMSALESPDMYFNQSDECIGVT